MEELLDELRQLAAARWSPPENLHITTRFIGEWPEARLGELKSALGTVAVPGPIRIAVEGFGFFPNAASPKTLYAGVHGGEPLTALARVTNDALETVGCARDTRPYSPHLTLARLKPENIGELHSRLNFMTNTRFGVFDATEFHLYRSEPQQGGGSVYTRLAGWGLQC